MAQTLSHEDLNLLERHCEKGDPEAKRRKLTERKFSVRDIDTKIRSAKYAVRGAVPARAAELGARLKASAAGLPFERLVLCNIGNPQAVQQQPISFYRQIAAALLDPSLLDANVYPQDVVSRAREYLQATNGAGIGAYTDSNGLMPVRQQVAAFMQRRDGFPANPRDIALTTGASEGVKRCISALITDSTCGMLIPSPQYPLYSAALTMTGGRIVYYDLFEDKAWRTTHEELSQAAADARADGTHLKAICVINPGNPVGAVLDREDVAMIVRFATDHKLVILADEVYQANVYAEGKAFHSFKRVLRELQAEEPERFAETQLISFHSTSKGLIGECGQRGGYMEFIGFSDRVMAQFTKMAATSLSSNTLGQIFVGMMVTPPKEGEPSDALFREQERGIFEGLKRRAVRLTEALNKVQGLKSQAIEGAMYAFPTVHLPKAFLEEAVREGKDADELWCLKLLEATGVVTVPGSGFGQAPGTYHFRTTILPPDEMLEDVISKLTAFQQDFYSKYGSA